MRSTNAFGATSRPPKRSSTSSRISYGRTRHHDPRCPPSTPTRRLHRLHCTHQPTSRRSSRTRYPPLPSYNNNSPNDVLLSPPTTTNHYSSISTSNFSSTRAAIHDRCDFVTDVKEPYFQSHLKVPRNFTPRMIHNHTRPSPSVTQNTSTAGKKPKSSNSTNSNLNTLPIDDFYHTILSLIAD